MLFASSHPCHSKFHPIRKHAKWKISQLTWDSATTVKTPTINWHVFKHFSTFLLCNELDAAGKLSDGNSKRKPSVLKDCHTAEKTVIIYIWPNAYNFFCVCENQSNIFIAKCLNHIQYKFGKLWRSASGLTYCYMLLVLSLTSDCHWHASW